MKERIVPAYTGDRSASVAIAWLSHEHRAALDAFHANVQLSVTGMSAVQLFQGQARLIGSEMVSHA